MKGRTEGMENSNQAAHLLKPLLIPLVVSLLFQQDTHCEPLSNDAYSCCYENDRDSFSL